MPEFVTSPDEIEETNYPLEEPVIKLMLNHYNPALLETMSQIPWSYAEQLYRPDMVKLIVELKAKLIPMANSLLNHAEAAIERLQLNPDELTDAYLELGVTRDSEEVEVPEVFAAMSRIISVGADHDYRGTRWGHSATVINQLKLYSSESLWPLDALMSRDEFISGILALDMNLNHTLSDNSVGRKRSDREMNLWKQRMVQFFYVERIVRQLNGDNEEASSL